RNQDSNSHSHQNPNTDSQSNLGVLSANSVRIGVDCGRDRDHRQHAARNRSRISRARLKRAFPTWLPREESRQRYWRGREVASNCTPWSYEGDATTGLPRFVRWSCALSWPLTRRLSHTKCCFPPHS